MIIVTTTQEHCYYLSDEDIQATAEENDISVEDCMSMLLKGEFELSEIEAHCTFSDRCLLNYKATEEK